MYDHSDIIVDISYLTWVTDGTLQMQYADAVLTVTYIHLYVSIACISVQVHVVCVSAHSGSL